VTRKGFTLVEVMIAMVILAIVGLAAMQSMSFVSRQGTSTRQKSVAAQKCLQIMEEMRGVAQSEGLEALEAHHQETGTSPVLTLRPVDKGAPLSGNAAETYARQIKVLLVSGQPDARRVEVRVYHAKDMALLAETVSLLRRPSSVYSATQVYDVYFLALENVLGGWTNLASLKPAMEGILNDLQIRNPGLEFRRHWIRRLALGRDTFYKPYVNKAKISQEADAYPSIYFYPGRVDALEGGRRLVYFDYNDMPGKHALDGVEAGTLPMADHFNHAMRYPDELKEAQEQVGFANADEFTLRLFLEAMSRDTSGKFSNVLIMNLHGEALPVPPLRNYSDPAKAPGDDKAVDARVVVHPERLRYPLNASGRNKDPIRLRVYSYLASTGTALNDVDKDAFLERDIAIRLPGVSAGATVRFLSLNGGGHYQWNVADDPGEAEVAIVSGETRIRIKKSPLRSARTSHGGLKEESRLYGWEYIPCETVNNKNADGDVAFKEGEGDLSVDDDRPKNTARWVIEIPADKVSGLLTVETRIADGDASTDDFALEAPRLSKTYAWVVSSDDSVPVTERYQYMGDPRHMPYADVKQRHGYNWYFNGPMITSDSTEAGVYVSTADYQGFDRYAQVDSPPRPDGWRNSFPQQVAVDVPRFHALWRGSLMKARAVYGSLAGSFHTQLCAGGEFGGSYRDGLDNGIPAVRGLWVQDKSKVDTITAQETGFTGDSDPLTVEQFGRIITARDGAWTSFPWLGELYPDAAFGAWKAQGNLPSDDYYRARYAGPFSFEPSVMTRYEGSASFMAGNDRKEDPDAYFAVNETYNTLTPAPVTPVGALMAESFNVSLPPTIKADRVFQLSYGDGTPTTHPPAEWNEAPYKTNRTRLTLVESYLENASTVADAESSMGLVTMTPDVPDGNVAHFMISGLSHQEGFGPAQISRMAVMGTLRAFLRLGAPDIPANQGWIAPLPRVEVDAPKDEQELPAGSTVDVRWNVDWTRWNGGAYTDNYIPAYNGPLSDLVFNVKYSINGDDWFCVQDGSEADWGQLAPGACKATASSSPASVAWDTSSLAPGKYHLMVEAFRADRSPHYSYHRTRIRLVK
jgi:prepilin-type N-terminal cleavage/methylation domain-containing protein